MARDPIRSRWSLGIPAVVFAAGLALTLLGASILDRREQAHLEELISAKLEDLRSHISASVNELTREIFLLAEHGSHSTDLPGPAWRENAADYLNVFPSLHAVGWFDRFSRPYTVVDRGDGSEIPLSELLAGEFAEATPGDTVARGSAPELRQVNLADGSAVMLIRIPTGVHHGPQGAVVAAFSTRALFEEFLSRFPVVNFTTAAFVAGSASDQPNTVGPTAAALQQQAQLEVHGLPLIVSVTPTPAFLESQIASGATLVIVTGLLISLLMAWIVNLALRMKLRAAQVTLLNRELQSEIIHRKEAEQRIEGIVNNVPANIAYIDAEQRYVFANVGVQKLYGLPEEAFVGKRLSDLQSDETYKKMLPHVEAVLKGERATFEAAWPNADGGASDYQTTYVPDIGESGRVIGFYSLSVDITELKVAETKLLQSNQELEQFAYVASHDLQEPLRMVSSYCQLLDRRYADKLDTDGREFLAFAVDGASRMHALINDLLAFSRAGNDGGELSRIDATWAVDEACANLESAIEESGAQVTHDDLPLVLADQRNLIQLFQNLIGNALKYHGEAPPRVHISAHRKGDSWTFAVRDNGIGIEQKYAVRIFQMFQRLHDRATYSGTGIGLAICKKIIERYGGRIWVESAAGEGATFKFTIPHTKGINHGTDRQRPSDRDPVDRGLARRRPANPGSVGRSESEEQVAYRA